MELEIKHSLLRKPWTTLLLLVIIGSMSTYVIAQQPKQTTKALYISLTDHYAALVAYERYHGQMKQADFQIQQMKNWNLLRTYFQSGEVGMAYVMSPLAMDIFTKQIMDLAVDINTFADPRFGTTTSLSSVQEASTTLGNQ